MTIGLSTSVRANRMTQIKDAIDGGSGAGTLKIYAGARPATGGAVGGATLLGTLTFSDPCGSVSAGVLTFSAITADASADADGTAAWARAADSAGGFVADLSVGVAGSGAEIILNTTNIVTGGQISVTSGQLTDGNA